MIIDKEKMRYEFALKRIEELLPIVTDETPVSDPAAVELAIMSDLVIAYENKYFPIEKPSVSDLIQLSLEEQGKTQRQLAKEIGVSPARISDYISGRSEPTLRIARRLCSSLNIAPALLLGI